MIKKVLDFNIARNKLAYNAENEIAMYNEEVKEFFEAKTVAERLDSLIDCEYVRIGTMLKLAYNGMDYENDLPFNRNAEKLMVSVIEAELGSDLFNIVTPIAEKIPRAATGAISEILKEAREAAVVKLVITTASPE